MGFWKANKVNNNGSNFRLILVKVAVVVEVLFEVVLLFLLETVKLVVAAVDNRKCTLLAAFYQFKERAADISASLTKWTC